MKVSDRWTCFLCWLPHCFLSFRYKDYLWIIPKSRWIVQFSEHQHEDGKRQIYSGICRQGNIYHLLIRLFLTHIFLSWRLFLWRWLLNSFIFPPFSQTGPDVSPHPQPFCFSRKVIRMLFAIPATAQRLGKVTQQKERHRKRVCVFQLWTKQFPWHRSIKG